MSRLLFLIIGLLALLLLGGYWVTQKEEVLPPTVHSVTEQSVSLEELLAQIPVSPIKTDTDEARFPWDEIDSERAFLQKTFTQPLEEMLGVSREMVRGLEQGEPLWCQPYQMASFEKQDSEQSWDIDHVKELVEDARDERSAPRVAGKEKQYETWSDWLVAMDEQLQIKDSKRLKKAVKQFQEDFENITDAYDEDLDTALQGIHESFDAAVYTKQSQSLKDPLMAWRALGAIPFITHGQAECPSLATLTMEERNQIKVEIRNWQRTVETDIRHISAGEAEGVRLGTQAATRFRETTLQHESAFDAAKSLLLRSVKE